eukprot:4858429-Karenia_brevis.AAC.1
MLGRARPLHMSQACQHFADTSNEDLTLIVREVTKNWTQPLPEAEPSAIAGGGGDEVFEDCGDAVWEESDGASDADFGDAVLQGCDDA